MILDTLSGLDGKILVASLFEGRHVLCILRVAFEGNLSLTVANELAQRIEDAGKPAVILYLADFDVKGYDMPANMAGKLAWLHQRGDLEQRVVIERLAVTKDQIETVEFPRKPIEENTASGTGDVAYNRRITEWEQEQGAGMTELNALEQQPEEFHRIVRDALERYTDPELPQRMKESIQLSLSEPPLLKTISFSQMFGVEHSRSTVHNWVHKADLQPADGQSPDHIAIDETVIRIVDHQYWLYTAVNPKLNRSSTCGCFQRL